MSLADKLTRYYPGAQWSLNGNTYDGLEWIGPGDKPTEQELAGLDFDIAKKTKRDEVGATLQTLLAGGYTVESGAMAGKVLQTRNIEDRANWLVSQASYSTAVAAGHGAVEGAQFRTADNQSSTVTFSEGLGILLAMAAWGAACMNRSWTLKDEIEAAQDQTELDAIDINEGWPS
jgi:hypothetical protein